MTQTAVPYNLRPKATRLAEGPDDSLEPSELPTDSAERTAAPFVWPRADTSKGSDGPADAPLAPPATDPATRTAPPFLWPRGLPTATPNRPRAETKSPIPALDPDIAMWPSVVVSIWPFTGPPTEGIWPVGWMGSDNTGTVYICKVGGEPGTWQAIGGAGVLTTWGAASTAEFKGPFTPVGSVTPNSEGDLYVQTAGPFLWQATGTADTDWEVVNQWGRVASAFFKGAGSPVGSVTPINTADLYVQTTPPLLWQASGPADTDWEIANPWGEASTAQFKGAGSPVGSVMPAGEGDLYVQTTGPFLWQATGTGDTDWECLNPAPTASVAGTLATPYDVTETETGFLTVGPLAVGVWVVMTSINCTLTDTSGAVNVILGESTATASFSGPTETGALLPDAGLDGNEFGLSFATRAEITVAGDLVLNAFGNNVEIEAIPLTGYVAIPVPA